MTYVNQQDLKKIAEELDIFRLQVHGGIYDLKLGNFGLEFWGGGFSARFYFHSGQIFISTHQESEYFDFSKNKVANKAHMHLQTKAGALDEFVKSWQALSIGTVKEASLDGVSAK